MSEGRPSASQKLKAFWAPLRTRDLVILPIISLLTVIVMLGGAEVGTRIVWPARQEVACGYHTANGVRFRPNCTAWNKAVDGPWVKNSFNDCGYRAAESCKITANQLRVAVLGSSIARGHGAPYQGTFAARASKILTGRCGRQVDFQNMATVAADVHIIDRRIPEALHIQPTVVVLLVNSYDIQYIEESPPKPGIYHFDLGSIKRIVTSSRLVTIGQHFLYQSPDVQLSVFLNAGADDAHGYVLTPLPSQWETRVNEMGAVIGRIAVQTKAAHIPFVLVYAPRRAQVLLNIPKYHHANVDSLALDRRMQQIAEADGATFLDTTPSLAASPRYNNLFYIADGHPTVDGHAVIARDIAALLLTMPEFAGCDRSPLPATS